jgi:hypothetical protein
VRLWLRSWAPPSTACLSARAALTHANPPPPPNLCASGLEDRIFLDLSVCASSVGAALLGLTAHAAWHETQWSATTWQLAEILTAACALAMAAACLSYIWHHRRPKTGEAGAPTAWLGAGAGEWGWQPWNPLPRTLT